VTGGPSDFGPRWSPDGASIAFERTGQIFVAGADGSGEHVLRVNSDGISDPAWSPDGRKIAYRSNDLISGPGLYTMNADGTDQRQIFHGNNFSQPNWSPDGAKLAYVSYADIWIANADGSGQTNVTRTDYGATGIVETAPSWSPDGTRLAFSRVAPAGSSREYYVYTISVDGSDLRRLETTNPIGLPWTWEPDWQPCPSTCPPAPGLRIKPPRTQQTIFLTVGPGNRISARNERGRKIKRISIILKTKFVLRDRSRRDNLHLRGGNVNVRTGVRFVGTKTLPAQMLKNGRYVFFSDAHPGRLRGHFSAVG
jgi:Tol biopolymer transport system component